MAWLGMAWHGIAAHGSGRVTVGTPGSGRWHLLGSGSDPDSDGPKMPLPGSDSDEDSDVSRKLLQENFKINGVAIIIDVFKRNCNPKR